MLGSSNRIKKKAFLLLCSQGRLVEAHEETECSLQSVNCLRANHLSAGNRKKTPLNSEFRVRTINNIQHYTLEKHKVASILLLRDNKNTQCLYRPVEYCVTRKEILPPIQTGCSLPTQGPPTPLHAQHPAPERRRQPARKRSLCKWEN